MRAGACPHSCVGLHKPNSIYARFFYKTSAPLTGTSQDGFGGEWGSQYQRWFSDVVLGLPCFGAKQIASRLIRGIKGLSVGEEAESE